MKGFVPTPVGTVDAMVDLLFHGRPPRADDKVLDPGCGTGEFIDGIIRWCARQGTALPHITGIESDPRHMPLLAEKYEQLPNVRILHADFLSNDRTSYDLIVGNPPYVAITALSATEKAQYRAHYTAARGRFDLYLLFFEQALRNLAPGGRLVFITPEKYLYVESAGPLRDLLARHHVEEIDLVSEDTFGELVTYPMITVVRSARPGRTRVRRRDGSQVTVTLPLGQGSWLPLFSGAVIQKGTKSLGEICVRISCGVATGADDAFVKLAADLDPGLLRFARPTIAGREITHQQTDLLWRYVMLMPYDSHGRLLSWARLGALRRHLMNADVRRRLMARTCAVRKPWYSFHETPPLRELLRPKILCKDICETPRFWADRSGEIVPRHSVYYLVPRNPAAIDVILAYLESPVAHEWLYQNCQRASKGFLRLQSRVLRRLPLPADVIRRIGIDPVVRQADITTRQAELALAGATKG